MKEKIYITLITRDENVAVGECFALKKEEGNAYDDEAILAEPVDYESEETNDSCDVIYDQNLYVANSVNTVARGTWSAGRLYDKLTKNMIAEVKFVVRGVAICEVREK